MPNLQDLIFAGKQHLMLANDGSSAHCVDSDIPGLAAFGTAMPVEHIIFGIHKHLVD